MPAIEGPSPQSPLPLETVDKSGRPPKSRLSDPTQALSLVRLMIEGRKRGLRKDQMIQGMFDGNPPYNSEKLKAAAQSWRSNFSTLEGKAHASAALAPYYDLFASVPMYMDVQLKDPDPFLQPIRSAIASEGIHRMLKDWPGFETNIWQMLYDFVGFGKGFVMFKDTERWKFRHVSRTRVLVPDGTGVDVDHDLETVVVRQSLKQHELWQSIKNRESAESAGWHYTNALRSIHNAVPKTQTDSQDWELIQQVMRDNDLYSSNRSSTIQLAHIFVREFSGKWSHSIIDENLIVKDGDRENSAGWLFHHVGRFKSFHNFMCPFFFEVLAGTWNGLSGIGQDIFAIMQAKDRVRCAQMDGLMMRQGVTLKALNASSVQKIGLVQFGAFNVIPPDFEVQQSTIFGDIESSIAVNRDLDAMIQANTGIYRPRIEQGPGNPETATEVQLKFSQATVLSNSAVNRFYAQLDHLYKEVYTRACSSSEEDAKEFREYCKERGVTTEMLKSVESVRAYRNSGNGSPTQRQQSLSTLASVVTMLPEPGRQAWIDDVIATTSGQGKVNRYNPKDPEQRTPMDQVWQATMENDNLANGSPVVLTPTQNDVVHAQTHLGAAAEALKSIQQGGDPARVLKFVDGVGAHTAEHLQRLAADPSRKMVLKALQAQWEQLADVADQYKRQLAEQSAHGQQVQQQAQELDAKMQLKAVETQAKIAQQQQKTDAMLAMKQQKHDADMAMRGQSHSQDMALKDASTATAITLKSQQAQANEAIQLEKAKSKPATDGSTD